MKAPLPPALNHTFEGGKEQHQEEEAFPNWENEQLSAIHKYKYTWA